ncbi:hypothetical protein NQ095_08870 [Rossellomorea sp. SC111]|uniref:hypothetical protein n=1 Tax=Rossellomorea sp. SC111 TaxID=2968985 RepID=UPI00215A3B2B|nr:hypothetical protein [Rossellomorea sp. SC111]MCR8848512.1 hypothetical protein [Rossellomorea sp. SC111]
MIASDIILNTWNKFNDFPMETLTKVWFYQQGSVKKQRDVSLMREHRERYGLSGNCFDLALWLLDEFKRDGIEAYPVGHNLGSEEAHAAVIALNEKGERFLCDLGDQWLNPILIDSKSPDYTSEKVDGFFPAAKVQVLDHPSDIEIAYHRPNGKVSKQVFQTERIEMETFLEAAEHSQHLIKNHPLLECRIPYQSETAHWEFYNWESFLSTTEGLMKDTKLDTVEEWAERIHGKTGYNKVILIEILDHYRKIQV